MPRPVPVHLHPTAPLAPARAAARRPRSRAAARPAADVRAEDVQPQPRAVGLHGDGGRRRAADDPEHRHGRPERRDRARRALRPRPASARSASGRAARSPATSRWATSSSPMRRSRATARAARSARASGSPPTPASSPRCAPPPAPGARAGTVATSDLFYDRDPARARDWAARGAIAVEMEAAALLRVGELRGVADRLPARRHGHVRRRRRRATASMRTASSRRASGSAASPPRRSRPAQAATRRSCRSSDRQDLTSIPGVSLRPSSAPGGRARARARRAAPRAGPTARE